MIYSCLSECSFVVCGNMRSFMCVRAQLQIFVILVSTDKHTIRTVYCWASIDGLLGWQNPLLLFAFMSLVCIVYLHIQVHNMWLACI